MKQFQLAYHDIPTLQRELQKIRLWKKSAVHSHTVFQILAEHPRREVVDSICSQIRRSMPDALYFGCSTSGSIMNGAIAPDEIVIICNIFEYPSTKTMLLQYTLTSETAADVTASLLEVLQDNPWVKCVEFFTTIRGMSMTEFCDGLGKARPDIRIFGGGAYNYEPDGNACVFSSVGEWNENSVVFWLIGGEDFHVELTHITGWKPLGKVFHVTRSEGSRLIELDHMPAYAVYYKYLNIRNDSHFFTNTLEFPFFYEHNGINILRAPVSSEPDGSLIMTSDMEENVQARLAYGDPQTILESVRNEGRIIRDFAPELIWVFSCAARRTFWGDSEVSKETEPFQAMAPTSGFYTSSEFLRTNGYVNQHNVTLVVAGMREGDPVAVDKTEMEIDESVFTGKVSLINRLASYINAAVRDLESAAIRDGMTHLYNRAEIQRRIAERLASGKPLSLIMMDIDNFKSVNDTFGHQEGDNVIIGLTELLHSGIAEHNPDASAGRWGGEEFMLLMPYELEYAQRAAARICKDFSELQFPKAGGQTLSLGVTQADPEEPLDDLLIRVDKALYEAKQTGKNRCVIYPAPQK